MNQYSQFRSNETPSLLPSAQLACPLREAVGEGHQQVISIPAAYSGVGSRIISFWSGGSITVPCGRRSAPPGWMSWAAAAVTGGKQWMALFKLFQKESPDRNKRDVYLCTAYTVKCSHWVSHREDESAYGGGGDTYFNTLWHNLVL